jgi:hypothetical protein
MGKLRLSSSGFAAARIQILSSGSLTVDLAFSWGRRVILRRLIL